MLEQVQDAPREGGGPTGHLPQTLSRPTTSARIERELQRRRHVCLNRCVVREDVERHYDPYGGLIIARLARWERFALLGWAVAAVAAVIFEGLSLFRP